MSIVAVLLVPAWLGYRAYGHFKEKRQRQTAFRRKCLEADRRRNVARMRRLGCSYWSRTQINRLDLIQGDKHAVLTKRITTEKWAL